MDMQTYYDQFENCLQEEKPFCGDDCPFHMDVLDFEDKLAAGRYNAAFKIYRNAVAFPEIVAAICPQYCTGRCPRNELGGGIQINRLEKTCIANTKKKDPNEYNLPARKGKVAIIGAGLSGLSCALRLASKKYDVTIYEKSSAIGGKLRELLPEEVFMEDINRQFKYENYTLQTDTEITDINELTAQGFDAIYVATGSGGADLGVLTCETAGSDIYCYLIEDTSSACHEATAVYGGGSLLGKDIIPAAADGLAIAREIEGFLKTGIIRYPEEPEKTKVETDPSNVAGSPAVPASASLATAIGEETIFTEDEMKSEIARCLRCQCDACRKHCDLTAYFDKWPLQMRDDIMTTTMPANSMIRKAPAIRLINMCTQCGLCGETCPGHIELGGMIKEARRMMHKIDRMPAAYHQFWMRDMEFANGNYAALAKCPPGKKSCEYAFFPGCHLGAADPEYVKKSYLALLKANDGVGLLLRCCGVPADWAGNEEVHQSAIEALKADWESLGKPTMIMACPSCMRHFREYLPEIQMISIYEAFEQWDAFPSGSIESAAYTDTTYSIFDPCAARNCDEMQDAVRKQLGKAGILFEELPGGDKHGCCGFGGNIEVASPKMAAKVASDRSALSDNPYITYCINCRDVFHDDGKPAVHALDILLGLDGPGDELPTVTERRCNRVILKEELLNEIWGETMTDKPILKYDLIIGPEMKSKMDSLKILEEDICHVIEMGELHGRKAFDPMKETYKCYREIGRITCWVEYKPSGDSYEIVNVYTHRMKIELEVVFNGRKTDFDLR